MKRIVIKNALFILAILLLTACGNRESAVATVFKTEKETEKPTTTSDGIVNYLNTLQSIDFRGIKYNLAWSNPPQMQGTYYIQEYMSDGQDINHYDQIFILDLFKNTDTSLKAEVKEKTDWLDNLKKTTDPTAEYTVSYNEKIDEYRVSLIVSDGDQVEWDLIRYLRYEENGKFAGVRTLTLSKRGYEGLKNFKSYLEKEQKKLTVDFIELPFPEIKL